MPEPTLAAFLQGRGIRLGDPRFNAILNPPTNDARTLPSHRPLEDLAHVLRFGSDRTLEDTTRDVNRFIARDPTMTGDEQRDLVSGFLGMGNVTRIPNPIRAYHGSPNEFDTFVTPAFFARREGVARQYRNEGGSGDNLNRLGGAAPPPGWYHANVAFDRAGQDRARAVALLQQEISDLSRPMPRDYAPRGLMDWVRGSPRQTTDQFNWFVRIQTEPRLQAIEHLQTGRPLGRMYEVELPQPTAHYSGLTGSQEGDIANAIAGRHRVVTWGGIGPNDPGAEIIALDPTVINILRRYGLLGPVAGVGAAGALGNRE